MPDSPPHWAIYYDDSSRYTDADGAPEDAPARGVIAIAQEHPEVGRVTLTRDDFYWWMGDDGWYGGDIFGLWDYLCTPGWKRVLFGRSVPDERYHAIVEQATEDDYLPSKSARHPRFEP